MKILVTILVVLLVLAAAPPARAELALMDEPRRDFTWYGMLFLGLSAGAFAVAANGYSESNDAIDKADDAYTLYKHAGTADDARRYHKLTRRYQKEAVGYESTANAAVLLGVIFGLTGVYCFFSTDRDTPILMSANSVTVRVRF